jgi:SAM-dependent MidA family methyltransferase
LNYQKANGYVSGCIPNWINKLLIEMGNKFKVLIQQKGIKSKALTGMQFSQQLV